MGGGEVDCDLCVVEHPGRNVCVKSIPTTTLLGQSWHYRARQASRSPLLASFVKRSSRLYDSREVSLIARSSVLSPSAPN